MFLLLNSILYYLYLVSKFVIHKPMIHPNIKHKMIGIILRLK